MPPSIYARKLIRPILSLMLSWLFTPAVAQSTGLMSICLQDDKGISAFISDMRNFATKHDTVFIDGSRETEQNLLETAKTVPSAKPTGRVVNVGFQLKNKQWVLAGNLGLARHQVALGVSDGLDPKEAQAVFQSIRAELGRSWNITVLHTNENAFPMRACD